MLLIWLLTFYHSRNYFLKELQSGLQDGSLKSIDVLRAFQWHALKSHLFRNNIVWVSNSMSVFVVWRRSQTTLPR